jgi:hypothetical protein
MVGDLRSASLCKRGDGEAAWSPWRRPLHPRPATSWFGWVRAVSTGPGTPCTGCPVGSRGMPGIDHPSRWRARRPSGEEMLQHVGAVLVPVQIVHALRLCATSSWSRAAISRAFTPRAAHGPPDQPGVLPTSPCHRLPGLVVEREPRYARRTTGARHDCVIPRPTPGQPSMELWPRRHRCIDHGPGRRLDRSFDTMSGGGAQASPSSSTSGAM